MPAPVSPEIRFQSAPGGEAGGNADRALALDEFQRFNPPPAVRPGETPPPGSGWERLTPFQSAPGGEAGGNMSIHRATASHRRFQSAPGGEAGGNGTG